MSRQVPFLTGMLFLSWLAVDLRADDAADKAVQTIEKLGGRVTRDNKKDGKPVIKVELTQTNATDDTLKELAAFPDLQSLNLFGSKQVTDAGLKELAACKQLNFLILTSCNKITDAGLKELAACEKLQTLSLNNNTGITDAGIKELAACKQLKSLNVIGCTKITRGGAAELMKQIPGLKVSR
jgi:Leucine Rich Repeat (LRR) protein